MMKTVSKPFFATLLCGMVFSANTFADIRLPKIFSSNMVLQQGHENLIWGWADPKEAVTISFANSKIETKADEAGIWKATLPNMNYGGPYTLFLKGKNSIELTNILIGEVWVCSGQSNMGMDVNSSLNSKQEIADANYPQIRLFSVRGKAAIAPKDDLDEGEWQLCSPTTVGRFSAAGYFFGRKLFTDLNVPIGLINSSYGGTNAETWMNGEAVQNDADMQESYKKVSTFDPAADRTEKINKIKAVIGDFPEKDLGFVNGIAVYAAPAFDDHVWSTVKVPSPWSTLIDGIGWYRKEFILTKEEASASIELHLSLIDDKDITWINGQQVGETNLSTESRIYQVAPKFLKEGTNVLAIRVTDGGGTGGMVGKPADIFIQTLAQKTPLTGDWKLKITEVYNSIIALSPNELPTLLYNSMINPLIPYGIKGVVWYQGEANVGKADMYGRIFPELISGWRKIWGLGDFPFIFVSLANFGQPVNQPSESTLAELREAQNKALKLPNTAMTSAIDVGMADNIHFANKQEVGRRLALNALKMVYHKDVVNSGPVFDHFSVASDQVNVFFDVANSPLNVKNKYGYINGFSIAGKDRKFYWAKGYLMDDRTVRISAEQVKEPIAVRYGWAGNPDDLNLNNKDGLPAGPFRTDDWSKVKLKIK
jgi:sialate O-acetylesterase